MYPFYIFNLTNKLNSYLTITKAPLIIKNITGDNTGLLHIREEQLLILSSATSVNSAVHLYNSSISYLPYFLTVHNGTSSFFKGQVCGLVQLEVFGTLNLGQTGYTCGHNAAPGIFNISQIFLSGGNIHSQNSESVVVFSHACLTNGGNFSGGISHEEPLSAPPICERMQ